MNNKPAAAHSKKSEAIARRLLQLYPHPRLELDFSSPLELLVALILAAQCRDERVNAVTRELFRKYRTAQDYAQATQAALEKDIHPTGFYKRKAKRIKDCCRKLVEDYGGQVPRRLEDLIRLPGVGRKTANLVRAAAFGEQAIAVDTHVRRVSKRLGLAHSDDPLRIEEELRARIPRRYWRDFTFAMILHGRRVCTARHPRCAECGLYPWCEWPARQQVRR